MEEDTLHIGARVRPLYVDGEVLYAGRGLDVLKSHDGGDSFTWYGTCPGQGGERWLSRSRLASRIGRLGIHAFRPLPTGGAVAVLRRRIVWCPPGGGPFQEVLRLNRGSRPLNMCLASSGQLYFGEYFSNPSRKAVHVYGSEDGARWSIQYTFPAGAIRHVHNIVEDTYRDGFWVLTGDSDDESGLWFTNDDFRTLDCLFSGSQRARAVSVIPMEKGLIVPTDTPREQNYIQFWEPGNGALTELAPLPNSAFHAVRKQDLFIIATAAEPSPCNDSKFATVFVSSDGAQWHCLAEFERDWPMARECHRFVNRALGHPEVQLVPGRNETDYVFAFGRGIGANDGRLLRWAEEQVITRLKQLTLQQAN